MGEFPCVAPTQGRGAAGQLNWGGEVTVKLLWGIFTTTAPECVWPHHIVADWLHQTVDVVVWTDATDVDDDDDDDDGATLYRAGSSVTTTEYSSAAGGPWQHVT